MARRKSVLGSILGPLSRKISLRQEQKAFNRATKSLKKRRVAGELLSAGLGMSDPSKSKSKRAVQKRRFQEIRSTIKRKKRF